MQMEEPEIDENKAPERILRESTPEEGVAMSRYIDLRSKAHNQLLSDLERTEFTQNLTGLVNLLHDRANIEPEFCEDLLVKIKVLEEHYLEIKKVAKIVKQLERESRGGFLVPHLYEKATDAAVFAISSGVLFSALEPLRKIVNEYLIMVKLNKLGR